MNLIPGQGHFGPDAIPGGAPAARSPALRRARLTQSPLLADARWRRGESVSLKTARDTLVPLELAQHAQMVYSKR